MSEQEKLDREILQIQQKFWPLKMKAVEALNAVNREYRKAIAEARAGAS